MENTSLIFEDSFELVPIRQLIGEVRGSEKPKGIVESPKSPLFRFQGFAVNLVYRSQAEVNHNIAPSILVEFVLRGLPELSWAYEEIYFGGEVLVNETSDSVVRIADMFPCKSDIPTSIDRTRLLENSSKAYDGIDLDFMKTADVIKLAETRDKRIGEIVQTGTLGFESIITSFKDDRFFHWKIRSVSEAGIQEQNHFYLWLFTDTKVDYVTMKFDLRALAVNAREEAPIGLEADGKDRKKERRIPINSQWMA